MTAAAAAMSEGRFSRAELERIRAESIAQGNFPEVMNTSECALFTRFSEDFLLKSDCPRSYTPGRGQKGHPRFLKSHVLLWLEKNLDVRLDEAPAVTRRRRRALRPM